jgi:hypothetical protein
MGRKLCEPLRVGDNPANGLAERMTGKRRHRSSRAFRPWGTLSALPNVVQQVFLSALAKRISHAAHGGTVVLSTGV